MHDDIQSHSKPYPPGEEDGARQPTENEMIEVAGLRLWQFIASNKRCVVFVGSGPSTGPHLYVSWDQLLQELCTECGVLAPNNLNPPTVEDRLTLADECRKSDEAKYLDTITKRFASPVSAMPDAYNFIVELPFSAFLTLNFDPMLHRAYQRRKCGPRKLFSYTTRELPVSDLQDGAMYLLHGAPWPHKKSKSDAYNNSKGDSERLQADDIVLTKSDFDRAYNDEPYLPDLLGHVFRECSIVFVGAKLSEPPLVRLLEKSMKQRDHILKRGRERDFEVRPPAKRLMLMEQDELNESGVRKRLEQLGIEYVGFPRIQDDYLGLVQVLEAAINRQQADAKQGGGTS